jgi:hypothetical protein
MVCFQAPLTYRQEEVADANEQEGKSGSYLIDCNVMPAVELAERLWKLTEERFGEKLVLQN